MHSRLTLWLAVVCLCACVDVSCRYRSHAKHYIFHLHIRIRIAVRQTWHPHRAVSKLIASHKRTISRPHIMLRANPNRAAHTSSDFIIIRWTYSLLFTDHKIRKALVLPRIHTPHELQSIILCTHVVSQLALNARTAFSHRHLYHRSPICVIITTSMCVHPNRVFVTVFMD